MPQKTIDLTGKQFGRLTVLYRSVENSPDNHPMWVCKCSCGNIKSIRSRSLRTGETKSCGRCKSTISPLHVRTHKNRLYHTWSEMIRRCSGHGTNARYYHGKGISICDQWKDYDNFADWAERSGYDQNFEIDRIDGDKGYSPENCRWVTHKQNSRNRKARSNNNTGYPGIHKREMKKGTAFRVVISTDNGRIRLGTFYNLEEAKAVRRAAELKYWGFNISE